MERMYSSSREPSPGSLISSIADTIAPSDTGTWCHTIHKLQAVRYKSHIIHDMIERMCSSSKEHETSYNWPIPGSLISSIADESALLDTCTWYRTTALHINYKRYDANRILHTTWWEFTQAQKSERLHLTNLQIQLAASLLKVCDNDVYLYINYRRYDISRMAWWSIFTQECNTSSWVHSLHMERMNPGAWHLLHLTFPRLPHPYISYLTAGSCNDIQSNSKCISDKLQLFRSCKSSKYDCN